MSQGGKGIEVIQLEANELPDDLMKEFESEVDLIKSKLMKKFRDDVQNLRTQMTERAHDSKSKRENLSLENISSLDQSSSIHHVQPKRDNEEGNAEWGQVTFMDENRSEKVPNSYRPSRRTSVFENPISLLNSSVDEKEDIPATIHGYTIYVTMTHHWSSAWLMLTLSIIIVACQLVILNTVAVNSLYLETCTVHTDCPLGQFCGNPDRWAKKSYCYNCENYDVLATEYEHDSITGLYYQNSSGVITDEINCTSVVNSVPGWDQGVVDYKYIIFNKSIIPDRNQKLCLQHLLCVNSNTIPGTCDHFTLNANLIAWNSLVTLIVSGVLGLGSSLLNEIDEARTEEKILTLALEKYSSSLSLVYRLPAQLAYIITRVRTYFIPFITAWATAGLILTDKFAVENIALNILAISFVVDLDDNAATILLSAHMRSELANFFDTVRNEADPRAWTSPVYSIFWSRFLSLIPVLIMIFHVMNGDESCGIQYVYAYTNAAYASLLVHSGGILLNSKSFDVFLVDLFRNCIAALWESLISFLTEERGRYGHNFIVAIILSCVTVLLASLLFYKRKL